MLALHCWRYCHRHACTSGSPPLVSLAVHGSNRRAPAADLDAQRDKLVAALLARPAGQSWLRLPCLLQRPSRKGAAAIMRSHMCVLRPAAAAVPAVHRCMRPSRLGCCCIGCRCCHAWQHSSVRPAWSHWRWRPAAGVQRCCRRWLPTCRPAVARLRVAVCRNVAYCSGGRASPNRAPLLQALHGMRTRRDRQQCASPQHTQQPLQPPSQRHASEGS